MIPTNNVIPRIYSGFRGADFRGEEINLVRSPDCLNVWKDYKEIDSIRTRPDLDLLHSFDDKVYGIYFYEIADKKMQIIHAGTKLYKIEGNSRTELFSNANARQSDAFIYDNIWYFKDGLNYLRFDGTDIKEVEGYIPTTTITKNPSGGGTLHEDANLLSSFRKNTFVGDGESREYILDAQHIDDGVEVYVNDEKWGEAENRRYEVDTELGKVTFLVDLPPAPLTDGQANVTIVFSKSKDENGNDITIAKRNKINKCTLLQVFDNRVFFSGNDDFPNMVWHSSLSDPTYCSDLDYYNEGLDTSKVKGLVAGNNVLWVFKEPNQANTTVFYHVPTIDSEYGKIYPSTHSSVSTGCVGKALNFNDDIIFFSGRGMEGVSGDITTEQAIAHRSTLVDRKLISEINYKDMIIEEWEGYLMVFVDNKAYLADSRATFENDAHIEYEWFYWEFDKSITCARVNEGILYVGTEDGVYTLTNTTNDVESYWTIPKDKFKYPQHQKTTNKRGCVSEATGDISLYVKTEKTDFELVGEYKGITDAFVSRIKRKKFKDLQLKFHSKTRFSLESATLEVFVGGYLKR